ncbi:hypothetical protein JYT76_02270 [Olleya sp. AH-315-F22]|nr:hypothetical protein [Olleya sp. AH-315-F22]
MKIRLLIGVLFLLIQVCSVIYARFIPERFFCWGPYDIQTKFEVTVVIDNKKLSFKESKERYRYKTKGWEQRSIHNIFLLISQYESTYGKNDNAKVSINYSTNGKAQQVWEYQN